MTEQSKSLFYASEVYFTDHQRFAHQNQTIGTRVMAYRSIQS
jgi:hypothetical protein